LDSPVASSRKCDAARWINPDLSMASPARFRGGAETEFLRGGSA
jgi:hypothetical protein